MIAHTELSCEALRWGIRRSHIKFAGNIKLKIYGELGCKSGKRMRRETRVFFEDSEQAIAEGFRPCGHCMKEEYKKWISLNK